MRLVLSIFLYLLITPAQAGVISIVIDDLGYSESLGQRAIDLPAAVTLSVLPSTPHSSSLINKASANGHEVMLHLPMQASEAAPQEPGTLTLDMSELELKDKIQQLISIYPNIAGVNNHMGSGMTSSDQQMQWLMQALADRPELFFLDSRTTALTVAQKQARLHQVPNTRRDVFLDNDPNDPEKIRAQLISLVNKAKRDGFALAIGHPHSITLRVLEQELPALESQGIELVPVSEYISRKNHHQEQLTSLQH